MERCGGAGEGLEIMGDWRELHSEGLHGLC